MSEFKGEHQEIIFPVAFVNMISKIPEERHLQMYDNRAVGSWQFAVLISFE